MNTKFLNQLFLKAAKISLRCAGDSVLDIGLVGSLSGHYGWHDTKLADLDVWMLVSEVDDEVLRFIFSLRKYFGKGLTEAYPEAHLVARAINGPYKPAPPSDGRPCVFLHILVDTKESYRNRPLFTRYAWRKYPTLCSPSLLKELSPSIPPSSVEFRSGPWGVEEVGAILKAKEVSYEELDLQDRVRRNLTVKLGSYEYTEFCLYSVMTTARNACRLLKIVEGDELRNELFGEFIQERSGSRTVQEVVELKRDVRESLLRADHTEKSYDVAMKWLDEVWDVVEALKETKRLNAE